MLIGTVKYSVVNFCRWAPIALAHDMSPSEVINSARKAADATYLDKVLISKVLVRHEEQRRVANDFKMISFDEFENCVRCVDRILIWVFKCNEKDAIVSEVGLEFF